MIATNQETTPSKRYQLEFFLWRAFFIAFPFYYFDKGKPQPSSFILVCLFVMVLFFSHGSHRLQKDATRALLYLFLFVAYATIVNFTWATLLVDSQPIIFPIFYWFDLLVFYSAIVLYSRDPARMVRVTREAVLVSVALQFVLSFFFATSGYRESLFFPNANQLGYYALVSASIMALPFYSDRASPIKQFMFIIGILMCVWLSMLSLSKAATISTMIFLVLANLGHAKRIPVFALIVGILVFINPEWLTDRADNLVDRLAGIGAEGGDDSAEGRGYDRIWENPGMLILGAGEGAYYRWDSFSKTGELHSTIGTIIFSYGIPGMLLAICFFTSVVRRGGLLILLFVLPEILFSLTHMSLRFVLTWVYFFMLLAVGLELQQVRAAKKKKRRSRPPTQPGLAQTQAGRLSSAKGS